MYPFIYFILLRQKAHVKHSFLHVSFLSRWLCTYVISRVHVYLSHEISSMQTHVHHKQTSGKHWFVVCFLFFFELTPYAHHACILKACTRVRSYLYQRAILHSSGKGQFKEQQTSSIYRRKYIRSSRTLMYIYIDIYIYAKHIAVCHLEYGLHNIEVRKNTDSHPNKWQQCKWTSMNVTLKQTVFTSSFFF